MSQTNSEQSVTDPMRRAKFETMLPGLLDAEAALMRLRAIGFDTISVTDCIDDCRVKITRIDREFPEIRATVEARRRYRSSS